MKVTVKIFREIKFMIDLTSENGQVLAHMNLTPGVELPVKHYIEAEDKWVEGKVLLIDDNIWFERPLETQEEDEFGGKETWPVNIEDLENTLKYNFWMGEGISKKEEN